MLRSKMSLAFGRASLTSVSRAGSLRGLGMSGGTVLRFVFVAFFLRFLLLLCSDSRAVFVVFWGI